MNKPTLLWAALVNPDGRNPWINHYTVANTREDCKRRFLDGLVEYYHKEWLAKVKFVRVYVVIAKGRGKA